MFGELLIDAIFREPNGIATYRKVSGSGAKVVGILTFGQWEVVRGHAIISFATTAQVEVVPD